MTVSLETLKKSVGKKNSKSKIFAWIADLERAAGEPETALNRIDGGLTLYADDVAALIVRAKILFELEKFEECVSQGEKILVKDPYNLAALKIMGDAYDKLGDEAHRNLCYRQFHDMDPLNNFWKDEYDVPVEAAFAAAATSLAEESFAMPSDDDSLNFSLGGDGLFDKSSEDEYVEEPAAEKPAAEETAEVEEKPAEPAPSPFSSPFSSPFGSPFEKSAEAPAEETPAVEEPAKKSVFGNDFLGGIADNDELPQESAPAAAQAPASSIFGGFNLNDSDSASADEDDPFAALAAMLPNSEASDDSILEDLSASLDAALQNAEYGAQNEEFPVDDNISGNDVNSALSDIFGLDDDLEAEETSSPKIEDIVLDEEAEANASSIFSAPKAAVEDKPMSVDNAFDSIFGEDELPEEIEPVVAEPAAVEPVAAEPAAEEEPVASDFDANKPTTVNNAFDSIFGEDELPEEKPVEPASAEDVFGSGMFEKSAGADIFGDSFAEPAAEESLELPAEETAEIPAAEFEMPAEESLELPAEETAEAPAAEFEMPAEESLELPAEKASGVADAFGSIFGDDEDLPEEKPVAEVETPVEPVISSPMDFVLEDDTKPAEAPASEPSLAIDNAFGSIFGDDDDLPEEKPVEPAAEEPVAEDSSADLTLAEQVDSAEAELELPAAEEKPTDDLALEMGGAFASMFGNDDELDLPEAKPSSVTDQESTSAAIEEVAATVGSEEAKSDLDKSFDSLFGDDDKFDLDLPSATEKPLSPDLGALENEVSGAFKGLFDMEDDSLDESMPSNKGVDFLMSGDSDDEVSASLINNPDAPLDRGAHELDESLNTRTLAEIYFDQGLYGKAVDIYTDLAQKEPDNEEIRARLDEIEKIYRTKFGGNA